MDIKSELLGHQSKMDFFFDLFDSEKKRRANADPRLRTGSGGELPPLRRERGHHVLSFRRYDSNRESNRIREERIRRELHRLYLWDGRL